MCSSLRVSLITKFPFSGFLGGSGPICIVFEEGVATGALEVPVGADVGCERD